MRRTRFWWVLILVLIGVACAGPFLAKKIHRALLRDWYAKLEVGDDAGAENYARIIRFVDPTGRVYVDYDRAMISRIRQLDAWRGFAEISLKELNNFNTADLSDADKEDVLLRKASLNAFLGNAQLAKIQARDYCEHLRPHQSSIHGCFGHVLQVSLYNLTRYSAIRIYGISQLAELMGELDGPSLTFYRLVSTNVIDQEAAKRIYQATVGEGGVDEVLLDAICRNPSYPLFACKK